MSRDISGKPQLALIHGWGLGSAVWQPVVEPLSRHYRVHLVDLPGYGYARVSKEKQKVLANMINGYLLNRKSLLLAFVLIDSNLPPTRNDLEFVNGLGEKSIPFALAFTKADRIGKMTVEKNIDLFMKELSKTWEQLPPYFITSSVRKTGKEEILGHIGKIIGR